MGKSLILFLMGTWQSVKDSRKNPPGTADNIQDYSATHETFSEKTKKKKKSLLRMPIEVSERVAEYRSTK